MKVKPWEGLEMHYLLRVAYDAGYHARMDAVRFNDAERLKMMEDDLVRLKNQHKQARLSYDLAFGHLTALGKQIDQLETQMEACRAGQLSFDLRPECPLS